MIQELGKEKLNNSYRNVEPQPSDRVFSFEGQSVYVFNGEYPDVPEVSMIEGDKTYLFSIGEDRYFLYMGKPETEGLDLVPVRELRYTPDRKFVFALYTAYHLYQWYRDNRYCGKLYKENNNNKHEFTTTNVGYDNLKIMNNGTKLYGVFLGYNNGSYKEKNEKIKSTAKGYSVGGYLDYAYNSGHELQSDLVLTYLQSKADYHILRNMEESKNDGFGIALTNKYKYEIKLKTESNSQHILKPILLTELSYNTVDGYESKTYKQKKFDVLSGALGTGLEYTIINSNQAHTLQGIVKGNIFESKDKINATLSGSDVYMSYSKEKYPIIAELNYIGKTQMNENLALEYSIGGEFRDDGAKGINGSLKLEYKF